MKKNISRTREKFSILVSNERGLILVLTILLLLVLGLLVFVGAQWAQTDIKRTKVYTKSRDSFYTAETGIQRAINFFNFDPITGMCPGEVENGFQDELDGTNWPPSLFQNASYEGGEYTVTIANNNDGNGSTDTDHTVILKSVGLKRNMPTTVEVTVFRPLFAPRRGIITEDELIGDGGFTVDGNNGLVHSNANFIQSGSSGATNGTTANNECCACAGISCSADQDIGKIDLPAPDVEFFRPIADYILLEGAGNPKILISNKDGDLSDDPVIEMIGTYDIITGTDADGNPITKTKKCWAPEGDTSTPSEALCTGSEPYATLTTNWENLNKTGGANTNWKVTGSVNPPNGIYFVEGNFESASSNSTPWEVTVIAEGNIDLGGGKEFINYVAKDGAGNPVYEQPVNDAFLVANRDIEISGSVSINTRGFIHVRDQVKLTGTVNLQGWVVAAGIYPSKKNENNPLPEGTGIVTGNVIGGNVHITYDDFIPSPLPSCVVKVLSWREVSNSG